METKMRQGAIDGALIAILLILSQPFHPLKGLIPEFVSFIISVPLWLAAMIFGHRLTPLVEGGVLLVYLILVGALLGVAFERKRLWGWLLLISLAIHHYVIYDEIGRQMGEVVQDLLNFI